MLGLTDFVLLKFKYSVHAQDNVLYYDRSLFSASTGFSQQPDEYAMIYGGREFKVDTSKLSTANTNWMQFVKASLIPIRVDSVEKTGGAFLSTYPINPYAYITSPGVYGMGAVSVDKIPSAQNGKLYPTEKAIIAGGIFVNPSTFAESYTKTVFQFKPSNGMFIPEYDDGEGIVPAEYGGAPYYQLPSLNEFRFNPFVDAGIYKTNPNDTTTWRNMYVVGCGGSASFEMLRSGRVLYTNTATPYETNTGESETLAWTKVTMSSQHLSGAMSISPDSNRLMFFGGYAGEGMEVYNLQPGPISLSASDAITQPVPRWNFGSAVDKTGRLWIAGGYAPGGTGSLLDDVSVFDYVANEWITMPSLPESVAGCKLVFSANSGSDEVFVIGGHNSSLQPVNGYVMNYLAGSPTWYPLSSSLLSDRVSGHAVVSLGPVSGTYSSNPQEKNSGSLIVTGGNSFRVDLTSTMTPNPLAVTEIIRKSGSINFASTLSLLDESAQGYNTLALPESNIKYMSIVIAGNAKIFPIASVVISGWSGSNGSGSIDLINSTTGSVFAPTGSFAIDPYSNEETYAVRFYVPNGAIKNNTNVYLQPVTSSRPYLTSSNKVNNIPSQILSISPSNIDVSASATALAPASSVTGTGHWMNYLSGVYFGNPSVYGNGVYFTSSFATGSDYYHTFRLPLSTSFITVGGQPVYLRANTLHDIYIKENNGATVGSFKSYYKVGQNSTPLKWLSGPASSSENASTSKLMWFKFNESSSSAAITESIDNAVYNNSASWASGADGAYYQQFRSDLIGGSRLLRGGKLRAAVPSANMLLTDYTSSAAGPNPVRDALGSGSYALEFWYYSPANGTVRSPSTVSTWVENFATIEDPNVHISNENFNPYVYDYKPWSNVNLANNNLSYNTYATASLIRYIPYINDSHEYEEYDYANMTSSFTQQFLNLIPEDSSITSFTVNARGYASQSGRIYLYVGIRHTGSQFRTSVVKLGPLGTGAASFTGTLTCNVTVPQYTFAGSMSKTELSSSTIYVTAINESSTATGSPVSVYLDYVTLSASYAWPQSVGKIGGFSSGSKYTSIANCGWEIDVSESYNTMNGYIITVGGLAPGPLSTGRGAFRNHNTRKWDSSVNFTGTNAAFESSSAQEIWTKNVLLQAGFDENQKMFVAWDVGPHVLTGGTVYGSNAVGRLFAYTFPQGDATWHHVCVNAPTASAYTWVSGATTMYAPMRSNIELYFDGVKVESGSVTGTVGNRNTFPAGSGSPWTSMTGGYLSTLVNTPPDFGFNASKSGYSSTSDKPGYSGVITLGPVRTAIIDDLVISSASLTANEILINYQKGKGIIY